MGAQYEKAVFLGEGEGYRGGQHNPPKFIIYFFYALPKDITKVISRSRDRLVDIGVIGYCHICK